MAKFDFDKPVASFSWYLQNGSTDDKRGSIVVSRYNRPELLPFCQK